MVLLPRMDATLSPSDQFIYYAHWTPIHSQGEVLLHTLRDSLFLQLTVLAIWYNWVNSAIIWELLKVKGK